MDGLVPGPGVVVDEHQAVAGSIYEGAWDIGLRSLTRRNLRALRAFGGPSLGAKKIRDLSASQTVAHVVVYRDAQSKREILIVRSCRCVGVGVRRHGNVLRAMRSPKRRSQYMRSNSFNRGGARASCGATVIGRRLSEMNHIVT